MLPLSVTVSRHPRRTSPSFFPRPHSHFGSSRVKPRETHPSPSRSSTPLYYPLSFQLLTDTPTQRARHNSFGINTFRALFIVTEGVPPTQVRSLHPEQGYGTIVRVSVNPLAAILARHIASVANKRLTSKLKCLDATFAKSRGRSRIIIRGLVPPAWRSRRTFFPDLRAAACWEPSRAWRGSGGCRSSAHERPVDRGYAECPASSPQFP